MPFFTIKNAVKNAALKKESNWSNKVVNVNNTFEETPCMPSDIKNVEWRKTQKLPLRMARMSW